MADSTPPTIVFRDPEVIEAGCETIFGLAIQPIGNALELVWAAATVAGERILFAAKPGELARQPTPLHEFLANLAI